MNCSDFIYGISLDNIKKINFTKLHVFPYSERKGTKAMELPEHVDINIKKERARRLLTVSKELENAQRTIKQLDEQKIKLETDKMNLEYKVDWFKAQTEKGYRDRQLDIEEKKVDIELAQLRDGNPYNDQIRNN